MSEAEFLLFHNMAQFLEILVYGISMASFFLSFLQAGRRRTGALWVAATYYAVYGFGELPEGFGWLRMLLVAGLLAAILGRLGMDCKFTLLLCAVYFCARNLSVMILRSVDFFLSELLLRGADTPEKVFLGAAVDHALVTALQLLLFCAMLYAVNRQLGREEATPHPRQLCCLLLFPVSGILFVNIVLRLLVVAREDTVFRLYETFPSFLWLVPAMAIALYAGMLFAIASHQKLLRLQEERERHMAERHQVHALRERMAETEQFYDSIRRMRHEMRNHLTNIKGLAESGCYADMEQYISRMDESMKALELTLKTGNAVTDIILNDKARAAARQGISFSCDFSYPMSAGYDAYDIGIIVSNLLQNALEACGRLTESKPYIRISGTQQKSFFLICVQNPYTGEVTLNQATGLPISAKEAFPTKEASSVKKAFPAKGAITAKKAFPAKEASPAKKDSPAKKAIHAKKAFPAKKASPTKEASLPIETAPLPRQPSLHGLGLRNVRWAAEKYGGSLDIRTEGHVFCATVLLQRRRQV